MRVRAAGEVRTFDNDFLLQASVDFYMARLNEQFESLGPVRLLQDMRAAQVRQ